MDVPFISSGALSRAHYVLVRKVEESSSEGSVNRILEAEVNTIREQLDRPGLSPRRSKEALIMLLYCSMTATTSIFPKGTFDFALPHALSLAEAGSTLEEKRTGYLFCAEMMKTDHEMRLMLVNTLRKDLEHSSVSRICLALNNIIATSSADVIPAIQTRLHDLLSHKHPSVRRRALYAIQRLSQHEHDLLEQVQPKILKRLQDPNVTVAAAALRAAQTMSSIKPDIAPSIQDAVNDVFEATVQAYSLPEPGPILTSLDVTLRIGLRTLSLPAAFDLVTSVASGQNAAATMGVYRLFKTFDPAALRAVEEQTGISLIGAIRDHLTSKTPNHIYMFLSCLTCVDTALWAGTAEAIPAALEGWEVEQIMQLLDSNDDLIRRMTLRLLGNVDEEILSTYYSRAISATTRIALPLKEINERIRRLLEVLQVVAGDNGELYAGHVRTLLARLEPHIAGNGILDSAIESVLVHIRLGESSFQVACAAAMLAVLCDDDAQIGPTMTIISTALATEYSRLVSFSPLNLLSGICRRLEGNSPTVQDPCLLALLRIAADCDEVPQDVTGTVLKVSQSAGQHIRRRAEQFLTLSDQKPILATIVRESRTLALPDFLEALEKHAGSARDKNTQKTLGAKFAQGSPSLPQTVSPGTSARKLRYEAYDTPQVIPSLRTGRPSSSQGGVSGVSPKQGSMSGYFFNSMTPESLSRSTTQRTLPEATLFDEVDIPIEGLSKPKLTAKTDVEDLTSRVDLIAFESPFAVGAIQTEVGGNEHAQQEIDFESTWNSDQDFPHRARGWCDAPMDDVVRRLQGIDRHRLQVTPADILPFEGDLKVMIVLDGAGTSGGVALLRLKDSDDDSSLWQMRCNDAVLRDQVKQLLGNQ